MVEDIFSFHEIKKKPDQRKKIDEIYRISTIEKIKKLTNKSKILKNNYCDCFFHNDSIDHGFGDKICSYHKNEQEIKDLKYILNVYDLDLHREKRKEKQRAIIEIEKEIFHKKLSFITIFLIFSFMIILGFFFF